MSNNMFCLRIDLDTAHSTPAALKNLLPVLEENRAKASFFIPLGGESNLLEIAATRGKGPKMASAHPLPKRELLRMAFSPKNYAEENKELLLGAIKKGSVVGCHGWKHREWTRSLETLDLRQAFAKMVSKYEELFGFSPTAFAAPGFRWDERVLGALDGHGFACGGELPGDRPFRPALGNRRFVHAQVPVNIIGRQARPLVEDLALEGNEDAQIVEAIVERIFEKLDGYGYACFYAHDYFECHLKFLIMKKIVERLAQSGVRFSTVEDAARDCRFFREISLLEKQG